MTKRHWFGTDGIRGVANQKLTPELALSLAMAAAEVLHELQEEQPIVLIGKDPRQSSDMLEAALAAGFASMGCRVELLGFVPTPAVAWLVQERGATMGAMISASHNLADDNGIKFFNRHGFKLSDQTELSIEEHLDQGPGERQIGQGVGRINRLSPLAREPYYEHLINSDLTEFKPMNIAVDMANGAMSDVAPMVLNRLNLNWHWLHRDPDGMNINRDCGSTHLDSLADYVQEHNLDLGIAFDGDGDRCLAVGPNGEMIDGDLMMYLAATYLPRLSEDKTVVATVMSNLGLEKSLEAQGKSLLRTGVGDRYVLEEMKANKLSLGGEQSGHLIFLDYQVTGDGLLSALQLINAIQHANKPIGELLSEMPIYPQLLKNVVIKPEWHHDWEQHDGLRSAIQQASSDLEGHGRLLVRASGTEPKLRVMAEGDNPQEVETVVDQLVHLVQVEMGVS